ncbi:hypothetical protein R1flu_011401 [Riccia fluitans]|uniref:Large ribosomal subunit protein uL10-like insertion domain-containing protein n=1 Tax=Riccia fluitans TaxID=41844 RepID=A0ABD1Z7P3_9MARC
MRNQVFKELRDKLKFSSRMFAECEGHDFAGTGSIATETVELPKGQLEKFTHDMEPFLRKQGMPVRLNKGDSSSEGYAIRESNLGEGIQQALAVF